MIKRIIVIKTMIIRYKRLLRKNTVAAESDEIRKHLLHLAEQICVTFPVRVSIALEPSDRGRALVQYLVAGVMRDIVVVVVDGGANFIGIVLEFVHGVDALQKRRVVFFVSFRFGDHSLNLVFSETICVDILCSVLSGALIVYTL